MLSLIKNTIQKFFYKKSISKIVSHEQTMSIKFILHQNDEIDIEYDIPSNKSMKLEDITGISERYAELLLGINYGLLKNQIIDNLKTHNTDSDDNQKILIIDNIIAFYDILKKEMLKKSAIYNQPVITPSMVFSNKSV